MVSDSPLEPTCELEDPRHILSMKYEASRKSGPFSDYAEHADDDEWMESMFEEFAGGS